MSKLTQKQRAFHLKKMRIRMMKLDVNKDGFISREDYELMVTRLYEYRKLDADKAEQTRNAFMYLADMLGLKPGVRIPLEEAAQNANKEYLDLATSADKGSSLLQKSHNLIFDVLDINKDGRISLDEFKVYFHIMAPSVDEADIIHSFNIIDGDRNGEITRKEFINAAIDFFHGFEETSIYSAFFGRLL